MTNPDIAPGDRVDPDTSSTPDNPSVPQTDHDTLTKNVTEPLGSLTKNVTSPEIDVRLAAALNEIIDGASIRSTALKYDMPEWQLRRAFAKWDSIDYAGAVKQLLVAKGVQAVEDWATASSQAAEKGRHEPARDLLTHAGIIEPVGQQQTQGTRIAIVIGTPDAPLPLSITETKT